MDILKDNEVCAFGNNSDLAASIASSTRVDGLPMDENQKDGEELQSLPPLTKKLTHININKLSNDI
jgi:hypothetical protein